MEAQEELEDVVQSGRTAEPLQTKETQEEAMPDEDRGAEPSEEEPADSVPLPSSMSSAPSRPKTVDLSIIAEAEEDRSSIVIPSKSVPANRPPSPPTADLGSSVTQPQSDAPAPITTTRAEEVLPLNTIQADIVASVPTAPPAPTIPPRQVRSSWLSKALGAGVTSNTQRTSDGTERSTLASGINNRLSTTDFPTMRKSLAQPGVLLKRKSEVVADPEEEVEERRPEKVARVEINNHPTPIAPVASAVAASLPAPSATLSKPIFDRQPSQEIFHRPGPSLALNQSISAAPETVTRERPSSEIDRVTKALDDMKERQQAKEVAKQKAALTSSVAATTSAPANRPKTTTGSGFLRGFTNLTKSLGLGSVALNQADPNEEEERRRLEEEEEERKAREELNEIMKKVDEPELEEKQEDVEMIEKNEVVIVAVPKKVEEEDELDSEEEAEVNQSIDFDSIPMDLGSPPKSTAQQYQSKTPTRLPRNQIQSTTPQGTPPRSLSVLIPSRTIQPSSSGQAQTTRQADIVPLGAAVASSTVHDHINLFNNASANTVTAPHTAHTPSAPVPRSAFLFSPSRNAAKQSDAVHTEEERNPATAPKQATRPAEQRHASPDTDNEADNETEEEREEVEEEEEEEEQIEKPTTSRPASQAGSMFGQASIIANKALGVKPKVGQVRSIQLAASAQKKVSIPLQAILPYDTG